MRPLTFSMRACESTPQTEVFWFLTHIAYTSALHVAAAEGHLDLVKSLLKLKADATLKDKLGNTPLTDAVLAKRDRVAAFIRVETPGIKYAMPGHELGGLMCEAAFEGDLDQIKRLMANGVGPNESNYDKRTALMTASCEGHIPVVTYLLEHGADIDIKDRFGGTALANAVRYSFEVRNAKQVQALLRSHGADLNFSTSDYTAKMNEYAHTGDIDGIRILAENKVDVSLGNFDRRTPLHLAACRFVYVCVHVCFYKYTF